MKKLLVFIAVILSLTGCAQNNTPKDKKLTGKAEQLDSLFTQLHNDKKFYGNVLIAEKGNIVYQKSFGKASLEKNTALDAESMFELASVSKQFTAMGIMLLKKQGKLNYEDSLRKFIPELPYYNITIRQLLNHTSGLPDYMGLFATNWDNKKIAVNKDMIALLAKYKPAILFAPGEKWEYSNTGYAMLASIIEKASGMEYGKYLEKNIFQPLVMKRTVVYRRRYENKIIDNYAYGYVMDQSRKEYVLPDSVPTTAMMVYALDGIVGDGTVNSTTNDLLKWDMVLYTEKLVSKEMMAEAFSPARLNNGKTHNYGFGWGIGKIEGIGKIINHSGGWPGYVTFIERHPESGKTIIILRNHETPEPPLQKIRNILYGIKEVAKKEILLAVESLDQYTGEYELAPGFIITITRENDKLYGQATGQEKFELFAEKEDMFFLKVVEAKLQFIRNEKGAINKLILYQGGQETEGLKIK
ncbi:MAG: serine hydrolase [Ferruginibacter sp.]|nr:serine hydrolase [Chitinophagaceae bacterium]